MKTKNLFRKPIFWAAMLLVLFLTACGGAAAEPTLEPATSCADGFYTLDNQEGAAVYFYGSTGYYLKKEGAYLAIYAGESLLYRAEVGSETILYGEIAETGEGIQVIATQADETFCFEVRYFPTLTGDELLLLEALNGKNVWDNWSQAINVNRGDNVPDGHQRISIGVLQKTDLRFDLIVVPDRDSLVIHHNDDWINPPQQESGKLYNFYVPLEDVELALSLVQYVPEPGWQLDSITEVKTADGGIFRIYHVSNTVPVVNLTDLTYNGPRTFLLVESKMANGQLISMNGVNDQAGNLHSIDPTEQLMLVIPVSPYDPDGIAKFLYDSTTQTILVEPQLTAAGLYCPTVINGFLFEFDVIEGGLVYFFKPCQ